MMKKFLLFFLIMFFATSLMAKKVTQSGCAYLYDYKTKSKRPIANVKLTVADAEPTTSGADGTFTLQFTGREIGDRIAHSKQPYYQGMKVFNKKEVDNWFIVKDPIKLIMCKYEEFELAKSTFYQQGLDAAKRKYEKQIEEINANAKLKEAEANRLRQEADEKYQKAMELLSESSEEMARIDQSELDEQMRDFFDLYDLGVV